TGESRYLRYDHKAFRYSRNSFKVWVGDSFFSQSKMSLNINEPDFMVKGEMKYTHSADFPSSFSSPGIMGWYSFVPFMQCKHGVVSMNQFANGQISINHALIEFNNGKSYIEKDWGSSFPSAWIWLQSNNFDNPQVSVMLSVAKIPWLGSFFMGFLAFLYLEGETYLFTTYNNSKFELKDYDDNFIFIDLRKKDMFLSIKIERKKSGELMAPDKGKMNRMIKESVDSIVEVTLSDKNGKTLFSGTGRRAGLEVTSNIFELIKNGI
ncbi:MAG: tocopherol cyclase family protein, partial [Bacteroidota bacterium]